MQTKNLNPSAGELYSRERRGIWTFYDGNICNYKKMSNRFLLSALKGLKHKKVKNLLLDKSKTVQAKTVERWLIKLNKEINLRDLQDFL